MCRYSCSSIQLKHYAMTNISTLVKADRLQLQCIGTGLDTVQPDTDTRKGEEQTDIK